MQTFTNKFNYGLRSLSLLAAMIFMGTWLNAQNVTYYSKAAATDFNNPASWGTATDGTGSSPAAVDSTNNFVIRNAANMTLSASCNVRSLIIGSTSAGNLTINNAAYKLSVQKGGRNNTTLTLAIGGLTITNGTLEVLGNVIMSGGTFTQSGGDFVVDPNSGTSTSSVATGTQIFNITAGTFAVTGGNWYFVDPPSVGAGHTIYGSTGSGVHNTLGGTHTTYFGGGPAGSVTNATSATVGFKCDGYISTGVFALNNVVVNGNDFSTTNTRYFLNSASDGIPIAGTLTINANSEARMSGSSLYPYCSSVGVNIVNNGVLTTTSQLVFGRNSGASLIASTVAQSVSGTGIYRNNTTTASSTANFSSVTINNTNASGVTFDANSLLCAAVPTNTGTVSGTLTFTAGIVNTPNSTTPFIVGVSTGTPGTLTHTSGGFSSGSAMRKWYGTTTMVTNTTTAGTNAFPFIVGGSSRMVQMNKSAAWTAGGWIQATHANASGLTAASITDGAYTVDLRSNASWSFTSGGGINLGATTLAVGIRGEGIIVTSAAPGTTPRFVQSAAAAVTHAPGSGTTSVPQANRIGLSLAQLTGSSHYLGINSADIGFYSIASADWNLGTTWSKGTVPTATDNPLISAGNTVTVSSGTATALSVTVAGTLTVSGGTLNVVGASGTGITVNAGSTMNVSGGTVNLGPQDNSFCNRAYTGNGTLNVSSGNFNVAGSLNVNAAGFITQSGGTIKVDGNAAGVAGNSASSYHVQFLQPAANTSLTGGDFIVVDPHNTTTYTIYVSNGSATAMNATGTHTFQFGDGVSTDAGGTNGLYMNLWVGSTNLAMNNVIVNLGSGTNRYLNSIYTYVVRGNMTLNANAESRVGTIYLGGNLTNNGILTSTSALNFANYDLQAGTITAVTTAQTISGSGVFRNLAASPTANLTSLRIQNSNASGVTMSLPLTMSGTLTMAQGKLNTTSTNILTMYSATGNVSTGTTTAGWVNGPMARRVPASTALNSFFAWMPVGKTAANYIVVNSSTDATGTVTFTAEAFDANSGTAGASIVSLNANRRWDINAAGPGVVTSYALQAYDAAMASGNAIVGSATAAGSYEIVGNGSSYSAAVAPLSQYLAMSTNELTPVFPLSFGFGQTGPLNIGLALAAQVTGPLATSTTAAASLTNAVERITISATGSSGTISLTDLAWQYTGTAASDITSVTLWTGTLTAPVTQIASVALSGGIATFTGLSASIAAGQNNFWIQVNISGSASIGNLVDGKVIAGSLAFATGGGATAPGAGTYPASDLDPAGNRYIDYCVPTYATGTGSGDLITNVTLAGSSITLNNTSVGAASPYYTYYNASNKPDIEQGSTYSASISFGTDGTQYSRIWIDFNKNGVFETTESFAPGTSAGSGGTSTVSITVPGGAALGDTRMRVRGGDDSAVPNTAACGASASGYGETEDYIVTITAPTPISVASITGTQVTGGMAAGATNQNLLRVNVAAAGSAGTITMNSFTFTYTGTSAADIAAAGVKLWTGTSTGPVTQIGTAQSLSAGTCTFSGLTSAIASGANYYWITVNAAAGATMDNLVDGEVAIGDIVFSSTGAAVAPGSQPTALVNPVGTRFIDYCAATYATGGTTDYVNSVAMNGQSINLLNTTGYNSVSPYYTFYSAANKPDLYQGGTYTLTLTFGSDGNQYSGVWIDFNHDGTFGTTEYFSTGTNAGGSGTANITISVPASTYLGDVRMRVRGGDDSPMTNAQACGATNSSYGETEDYIVTLTTPPGCAANLGLLPVTATATASNVSMCVGSSTTLNITTPTALPVLSGITYQWESDVAVGGAYSTIVATTSTPLYTFSPSATKYYRCRVLCNSTFAGLLSSSVLVTVNNPQITASTGASRCGQGTVNLTATGPGTIYWYDSPTGAPLASGGTYSPVVTASSTFYAAARVGGVTENAGKVSSPGTDGSYLGTDNGIQFNALQEFILNSVNVYPDGSGNINIALYNSGGIEIASTGTVAVSGSGVATPVVVPLGFNVQIGTGYTLRIKATNVALYRDFTGGPYPYNSTSGAISVTSGWGFSATTTTNYFFYNLEIATGCIGDKVPVAVTVNPPTPLVMIPGSTAAVCSGVSTNISVLSADLGYTYTWDNGLGAGAAKTIAPTTSGTYVVTAVNSSTGCNTTGSIAVTVNALPSAPTVTSSAPSYCPVVLDAPSLLTATSTLSNVIMSQSFESGIGTWTVTNNSTGPDAPTIAAQAWAVQTSPYTYNTYGPFSSGASGNKFLMANSDVSTSSTYTTTTLAESPVFAIPAGSTAASLTFRHYYQYWNTSDIARVQISTDGGASYSLLQNFDNGAADIGTETAFQSQTINLLPYVGQSNLRIRFRYVAVWGYFWAIDDVVVNASIPTNSFSFSPAGGLFNDLATTTQYVADNVQTSVYAAPFSSTTYNVSVVNPLTNCVSAPSTTTVTVCSAVTDIICGAATVTVNDAPPASTAVIPVYNSIGTTTGGQAGTCQAFTNDAWYKVMVPSSGDIHVYTFENGSTLLDLQQTMITIFTSSDGTCSGTLTQVSCDNGSGQGAHSYASAAGLTPGLYAYVRVSTPTTAPTPAGKYKMWVMSGLYWTATASTNWTDPANWYGGDATTPSIVPDQNKTVIIPNNTANNYPVISGTSAICAGITFRTNSIVNVPSINIPSGAELKIQSKLGTKKAFIRSNGAYAASLIPSFTGIGTLRFNEGGNNQAEVLNRVTFKGVVAVRNTVSVASNGNMRFDNNAVLLSGGVAPTDPLKNYAGTVTGDIRVTRTGSVYGGFNYWCSPITNATTAALATSYGNNLYQYDNTLAGGSIQGAWGNVITSPIPMQAGRGYIQTYAGNGTVVFTGPAREGFFNTPVTVTAGNNFNLIGNPYPSALSYDLLRGGNASLGSIYLWHSSGAAPYNTSSYVVMSGPNGGPYVVAGNPVAGFSATEIGVGQGFLAQVSSAGNIAFNSNQRVSAYPGNSTQFLDAADYSTMKVRLTSPSQSAFDAVVAFGGSGTDGVDFGLDAPRMPSSNTFELFTYIDGGEYTIQFAGALQATKVINLGTVMTAPGTYSFSLENFDNFDASARVYIEDVKTGAFQSLKAGSPYSFVNDPSFTGTRFKLHFMAPIAYTASGSCINETNGKIIVVNPNSNNNVTASLRDAQGAVIATSAPFAGEHEFTNLGSGSYSLEASYDGSDVFASAITVDGGGISSPATFVASANEVSIADAIVEFSANAPGANVFEWNFGDGSPEVTGTTTPVHAYMEPGIYTVTLKASLNGGCATAATSTVTVTDNATGLANVAGNSGFTIYPNPANEVANLLFNADLKDSEVTISITDAAGRIVSKKNVNNLRSGAIVGLDINELANGVYEVTVAGKNFRNVGRLTIAK